MDNLNEFLQPKESPINKYRYVGAAQFDYETERGAVRSMQIQDAAISNAKIGTAAIGTANIGTLTFNEISGGTAFFGGTANGDGVVSVLNSGGTEVVRLDNTGVTVTDGRFLLQNSGSTTIVDSTGIVSDTNANFELNDVSSGVEISTSSSSFVDVSGSSISLTLTRTARVLVYLFAYGENDDFDSGTNATEVQIYDTLTAATTGVNAYLTGEWFTEVDWDTGTGLINSTTVRVAAQTESNMGIVVMNAGTHTLKLRYRADGGVARLYNWTIGFITFGK